MKKYQSLVILTPNAEQAAIDSFKKKVEKAVVKHKGQLENVEEIGRRELATIFDKNHEGIFLRITFQSEAQGPSELANVVRVSDEAIRVLTVTYDSLEQKEKAG